MKTDLITINNQGMGFPAALRECRKAAEYRKLEKKPALQLELLTEELLSMARSVTGDMKGTFWIESEGMRFDLHLSTQTIMDREKREQLLDVSTSKQNAAAVGIMAKIRIAAEFLLVDYEEASKMSETFYVPGTPSVISLADPTWSLSSYREDAKKAKGEVWDELEKSIVANLADDVVVALEGRQVDIVVKKEFV